MFRNFSIRKHHLGLTREDFTVLLDSLAELRQEAVKPQGLSKITHHNLGICCNWGVFAEKHAYSYNERASITYELVSQFSKGWHHTTSPGECSPRPVPHDWNYGKWEGPNLAMRLSLMAYIRKRLRDLRRRAPAA